MLFNAHHELGFFEWNKTTNILKTDRETTEKKNEKKNYVERRKKTHTKTK